MYIIDVCPKCGADLFTSVICTYPPIEQKDCPSCGYHWASIQEVKRVIFDPNTKEDDYARY